MDTEYYGAKFYSKTDMSIGWDLEKAEKVINNFNDKTIHYDINSILELYNICLLFESEVRLKIWDDKYYEEMKLTVSKFKSIIGLFFSKVNYEDIKSFYPKISFHYRDTFWEIFIPYKIDKKFSSEEFSELLINNNIPLYLILCQKKIIELFDAEISNYMEKTDSTAELLILHNLKQKDIDSKKYYIPRSLGIDKQMIIIEKYIEAEDVNLNYLELLYKSRSTMDFPIKDELRLKAKQKYEEYLGDFSITEHGFDFGATVGFANIEEVISYSNENMLIPEIIYSRLWLKENLDNSTLLNNFIYLFEYTDLHFRSQFPSKPNEIGILEKVIGLKGKREYEIGPVFSFKEMISSMQIKVYSDELMKFNKKLEDIFKWFFEEYLKDEFKAYDFIFSSPTEESNFLEKTRSMCSELDSILRQFDNYVKNGMINRELIEISRSTPSIEDISSFFPIKYGYIKDSELINISYQLFSNQSSICYIEGKEYSTFEELIKNEKLKISDFFEYQKKNLEWLIDKNIIYKDKGGYLKLRGEIVDILKDYYFNEVICLKFHNNNPVLNTLISENKIYYEGKLFSKPEQKYLNFMLNDREFENGPALRNKYAHGNNSQNAKEHENDYFQLLKILALVIIKINEEFCWKNNE